MNPAYAPSTEPRARKRRKRHRQRRLRRRVFGVLLLVLLGVVGFAIWTAVPAVRAAEDARRQMHALQAARQTLGQGSATAELTALDGHVARLTDDLHTIQSAWGLWRGPLLFFSQLIPSAHDQLQQADSMLGLSAQVADAGDRLLSTVLPIVKQTQGALSTGSTPALVSRLTAVRPVLSALAVQFRQAEQLRESIDQAHLPTTLQSDMRILDQYLPGAPAAMQALAALPVALGADGPRNYLVVPQNNEDLRASGGFIGTVALLHVDHGHIKLRDAEDSYAVDGCKSVQLVCPQGIRPNVNPPLPLELHGWYSWFFRDVNWSADFPTTAQLLAIVYRLGTHQHVDGVIAVTPSFLSTVVALTGPVTVPGYGTVLEAGNAFQQIDSQVNGPTGVGKAFAIAAYTALFDRLLATPHLANSATVDLLRQNVQSRDLQLFSYDPTVERAIRGMGADGAIDSTLSDYLYVVDTNVSTNKVNPLIQEQISYQAVIQLDHTILATLTIRYVNDADKANLPAQNGEPFYGDFVRVFVPEGSTLQSASGLDQHWPTYTVHHKTQFSGYFGLASHQMRIITFQYRIPASADPGQQYMLHIQRQPGSGVNPIQATISTTWTGGLPTGLVQLRAELTHDLTVSSPLLGGIEINVAPPAPPQEPLLVPGAHPEPWVSVPTGEGPLLGPGAPPVSLSG